MPAREMYRNSATVLVRWIYSGFRKRRASEATISPTPDSHNVAGSGTVAAWASTPTVPAICSCTGSLKY